VDTFSALAGRSVLAYQEIFSRRIEESIAERRRVAQALRGISGVRVYTSEANYLLIKVVDAQRIWQRLYDEKGILLRDFSAAPYLKDCLRISMGSPKENDEFLEAFEELVKEAS
jgi:histidinol-phosphate aminotransferase